MPKMPKMPKLSGFFGGLNQRGGGGGLTIDPSAEQRGREEDIKARMRESALLHQMDTDEAKAQFPFGRAELGQSMAERGLGLSGIRTGAEGRQLADFTSAIGRSQVEQQMEQDALRRQLDLLKTSSRNSGGGRGGFPWGVFSGLE